MPTRSRPLVLIVDDDPDGVTPQKVELEEHVDVIVKDPGAVIARDLRRASLVLVDYQVSQWPARDSAPELALKPRDGLALASVLRSHLAAEDQPRATAFALLSGRLKELAGGLPPVYREHSIARSHNLEWVFTKHEAKGRPPFTTQVVALARAVRRLPQVWPRDDAAQMAAEVSRLLGLKRRERWYARAWEDIEECHPPFHELATASHGLAFLRWMLQRILPYPCFLIPTPYLAARFHVTPASLANALRDDKKLRSKLKPASYSGVVSDFAGERWWRAGIEDLVWRLTKGRPFDRLLLRTVAVEKLSTQLVPVELEDPVVCLDGRF
ncbi:MAG TPA: hypothetical protein VNJ06_16390, partial [Gemmatimonadales bacterium]|nr:hypothetical protein [Gemmatimonadales bacterium]